jgi:hypothetical protein
MSEKSDRRVFLNKALNKGLSKTVLTAAAIGAACTFEERNLLAALEDKANTTPKHKVSIAPGSLPCGKIGKLSISRLVIGGNLIAGFSHSRDMLYLSSLFKAYNTEARVFDTLEICEQCGINMVTVNPTCQAVVERYKRERGGKIQSLVCTHPKTDEAKTQDEVKQLIDAGATALFVRGEDADRFTMEGRIDVIGKAVDLIKRQGIPAGVGSHSLETTMACEKNKLATDFYVKTFHMDRYWSATPEAGREEWCWEKPQAADHDGFHDNMWCLDAEKTAAFMATVDKPWIAFKVMAAGAIPPKVGFAHAFRNGADIILAGMFDFQVETDVQIAIDTLKKLDTRPRPWRA